MRRSRFHRLRKPARCSQATRSHSCQKEMKANGHRKSVTGRGRLRYSTLQPSSLFPLGEAHMYPSLRNTISLAGLLLAIAAVPLAQQTPPPVGQPAPAAAAAPQVPAQPPPESQGTATVLKVKTRLVIVDVIALDHKGSPVTDLEAKDFILME